MIMNGSDPWLMVLCLSVALLLSTAIGLERQVKQKSAGMRTHALVGMGAALFMVISKYGFTDVLAADLVRVDPSRVAAQIVSGIGFIGAGLVFVRRNKVRGLTTAASIWLTAAVATAAGAGLVVPAVFVTATHFLIVYLYPWLVRSTSMGRQRQHTVVVSYRDGAGALRDILHACTEEGFAVLGFRVLSSVAEGSGGLLNRSATAGDHVKVLERTVDAELEIEGGSSTVALISHVSALNAVVACDVDADGDQ